MTENMGGSPPGHPLSPSTTPRASSSAEQNVTTSAPVGQELAQGQRQKPITARKFARHTIGVILLLITVLLWTVSNFLASTIFADNSYSKPYFVTYVNSSFFSLFMVFVFVRRIFKIQTPSLQPNPDQSKASNISPRHEEDEPFLKPTPDSSRSSQVSIRRPLIVDDSEVDLSFRNHQANLRLNVQETAWLSFEFCILWFLANYFVAACLEYTTVASSTILASTSSIWTLLLGAVLKVENFTIKKLLGTLASLFGIILISSVDLTGNTDKNRGDFPHKSQAELAIGDALAFASALLYGVYTTLMKKKIGTESRVDMPLFFGFVGVFNLVLLLPGFFFLHYTGVETFQLPPDQRITSIVLINSATSLVSDFCWAYSMLLTSPLVVTVGLSLTIPLSLFGQIIVNNQTSGVMYWIGALVVFSSFIFINYESSEASDAERVHPDETKYKRYSGYLWAPFRHVSKFSIFTLRRTHQ